MIWPVRRAAVGSKTMVVVLLVLGVLGAACGGDNGFPVRSSAFKAGGNIPEQFSCQGLNEPPPLSWSGLPEDAASVAVVVTDPDAPRGTFVHWIVVDLPAATTSLTSAPPPAPARIEPNSAGQAGYTGMCPPRGKAHKYVFEVLALPGPVTFAPGASPLAKVEALRDAASASGRLTGTYQAP